MALLPDWSRTWARRTSRQPGSRFRTDMDAVQISDVTKTFGAVTAVKDLRLNIPEDSIDGFTGPNGSGKTTTMRMIVNIFYPDSGSIRVFGQPSSAGQIGMVGYLPEER